MKGNGCSNDWHLARQMFIFITVAAAAAAAVNYCLQDHVLKAAACTVGEALLL